ncbi:uncharacterized protein J7T54_007368 [Emericellopsis cladophorae]|uniref:Uncharacterized protein n=1 Tax=Emericellopsis cladophorae TaxID=2686198 RepID=A0A9P9Y0H8_9HYPO|nr:uncharacterized protein J7T54_007368 [Emericellopsis cladophorae]KAI6780888.1 hypothetical protein J7T54_007368 [Emericellopsis cladophorae]
MGSAGSPDLLTEGLVQYRKADDPSSMRSLLAVGEIADLRVPKKPSVIHVLAAPAGDSGELLRLSRVEDSRWAWDDGEHAQLNLSVVDPTDQDSENFWQSDGLPITQMRFISTVDPQVATLRWLIVQKSTSTTILCPEYSHVPITQTISLDSDRKTLSWIKPNPVVTVGYVQTGGNAHVDFAYNPPALDRKPQFCVMDECGYWTLWNVEAFTRTGKANMRLTPHRKGHIWEGPLRQVPQRSLYPAQQHGVLFVGDEDSSGFVVEVLPTKKPSRHLLLWNSQLLRTVHLESGQHLPDIPGFTTGDRALGSILDVQANPSNQNHIFALTTKYLVWINLFPTTGTSKEMPRLLLKCPHDCHKPDLPKMAICGVAEGSHAEAMISLTIPKSNTLRVLWFFMDGESGLPSWHSQLTILAVGSGDAFQVQQLALTPSRITVHPQGRMGLGHKYLQAGVQFYQGMMLARDLSVRYCMFYICNDPSLIVTLPVERLNWSRTDQNRRWRFKRLQMFKYMGDAVVIPDSMTDEAMLSLARISQNTRHRKGVEPKTALQPRKYDRDHDCVAMRVNHILPFLEDEMRRGLGGGGAGLSMSLLRGIGEALQSGLADGRLSLMTWKEISAKVPPSDDAHELPAEEMEENISEVLGHAEENTIITQLDRCHPDEPDRPVGSLPLLQKQLTSIWVDPLRGHISEDDLRLKQDHALELAKDLFLSTQGIAFQDVPLFGLPSADNPMDSQQSISSAIAFASSQQSSAVSDSSAFSSDPVAPPPADDAFKRLGLLAPTIQPGKFGAVKPASVLSFWPTERGSDLKDYTSSVALATERQFDPARQRLASRERKRKATAEKYKMPPLKRGGSPLKYATPAGASSQEAPRSTQVPIRPGMSSQVPESSQMPLRPAPATSQVRNSRLLESSQSQPRIAMSQPLPGAFGATGKKPKKVVKKKRSGFR